MRHAALFAAVTALAAHAAGLRTAEAAPSAHAGGAPGRAADAGDILLLVNDEPILKSTVDKIVEPMTRTRLPREHLMRFRQRAVQALVTDMLISQFLREKGYAPTEEQIDAEVARKGLVYEKARQPGAPSFEESLRRRGASVEQMRTNPTARMRFSCYVRSTMTERDVKRLFETERHAFDCTQVRASHILIGKGQGGAADQTAAPPAQPGAESDAATAREKAEELRRRAAAGEDFAALAKENSVCPSAKKGGDPSAEGDLGFFTRRGAMARHFGEDFASAAFLLDPGEVSPVVESDYGFHVIRVAEIRRGKDVQLDEVRGEVEDVWAERRGREIYDELQRAATIERPAAPSGARHDGVAPSGPPPPAR